MAEEMRVFGWDEPFGKETKGRKGHSELEATLRAWRNSGDYKSQIPQLWVAAALHPTAPSASWASAREPRSLGEAAAAAAGGCAVPRGRLSWAPPVPLFSALPHLAEVGMAAPALSQEAVLGFLRENGGKVRNSELLSRFKPLLEPPGGEPEERAALRDSFKYFVNSVAVVKEQDGAKFVVLRKKLLRALDGEEPDPAPTEGCAGDAQEEEEGEGAGVDAGVPLSPEQGAPEENQGMPVSELKSLFQKGDMEGPKVPSGKDMWAPRAPLQKPCMLPVRCVLPPRAPKGTDELPSEQEEPEAKDWLQVGRIASMPPRSPYTKRRQLDDTGSTSPYLRRVQKSQKVGEEAVCEATVPLEAAEHEWLVKATDGQWSQRLHGLLLRDKNLAGKRDFMSGFTVLHWAAKSGNCDMVNKVIEVAEKGSGHVNVNTKSYGGYTPLHIAAIHGQEEIIALLVKDYNAKVNLRDYSGKKPYQYLKEGSSFAVRHLLRDPDLHTITGHNASIKKNAKVAASILSSTSTFLGVLSDDTAFYELTKGLKKPASLNKFLNAATAPRRKLKSRGTFSSHSSLSESLEEDQEEATSKRRPVSELFFSH
ncbi:ankyrin repeat domain-containing protein SOWAHA [Eublepharis macularius]|uniref:Ankyrin repeat domain-containing protein SOWAHA n=1 Tax=Eublepharis macularius TaxID=481883 RepID=A0AA97KVA6_EUBMA|nr:ankyrin repeat domain-containing protein SOWAHA [Eublepharis macularius]